MYLVNVAASTVHVGPRYEALSAVEKVQALVAAEGYAALLTQAVPEPSPPEEGSFYFGLAVIAMGAFFVILDLEALAFGMAGPMLLFGLLFAMLGLWLILHARARVRDYRETAPELLPACIRSRDFIGSENGAGAGSGAFSISFVTAEGETRSAELPLWLGDVLAVGDVGVLCLRAGRVVDFRALHVRQGQPGGQDEDAHDGDPPLQIGGWPALIVPHMSDDDRGAVV